MSRRHPLAKPFYSKWPWPRRIIRLKSWRTDEIFKGDRIPASIKSNPFRVLRIDIGRHSIGVMIRVKGRA